MNHRGISRRRCSSLRCSQHELLMREATSSYVIETNFISVSSKYVAGLSTSYMRVYIAEIKDIRKKPSKKLCEKRMELRTW